MIDQYFINCLRICTKNNMNYELSWCLLAICMSAFFGVLLCYSELFWVLIHYFEYFLDICLHYVIVYHFFNWYWSVIQGHFLFTWFTFLDNFEQGSARIAADLSRLASWILLSLINMIFLLINILNSAYLPSFRYLIQSWV